MSNFFREVIAKLIQNEFEAHTTFSVCSDTAIGENPVRTLKLDAVPVGNEVLVSLAWDGGEKIFERKYSGDEGKHTFALISSDLAEAVSLTQKGEYYAAKELIKNLSSKYAENTGEITPTNEPKITTTMASIKKAELDNNVRQYLETALWSTNDNSNPETGGEPLDKNYSIDDLTPESIQKAQDDWNSFVSKSNGLLDGLDMTQVAHDFWLTRNGHGTGFWEADYTDQKTADALTEIAHSFGEADIYVGDTGKLYLESSLHLWKQAKVSLRNIFPSGTIQDLSFDTQEELTVYQEKMKGSAQDRIPLWDAVAKNKDESGDEEMDTLAPSNLSYEDQEKQDAKETKNLDKRIKETVKTELESSLEEKKATMFGEKDEKLIEGLKAVGRTWDEIKKFMVKELSYDKESVDLYIDDLRSKEEGVPLEEEPLPEAPKPPENLVSPETHEQLLKDIEDKKTSPKEEVKEEIEKVEEPIKEESALKCPECGGKGTLEFNDARKKFLIPCDNCGVEDEKQPMPEMESISRADNTEIRKVALNPLQEPPVIEPKPDMPSQDVVPMGESSAHPSPRKGDRVFVTSDMGSEKAGTEATFVSNYKSKGTDYSIVETDDGELLDVESHRLSTIAPTEKPAEPISAPELEVPELHDDTNPAITPKLSDLSSNLKKKSFNYYGAQILLENDNTWRIAVGDTIRPEKFETERQAERWIDKNQDYIKGAELPKESSTSPLKREELYNEAAVKCPKCGENIWDVAGGGMTGAKLNKCWNCGTAFDSPEEEASLEAIQADLRKLEAQLDKISYMSGQCATCGKPTPAKDEISYCTECINKKNPADLLPVAAALGDTQLLVVYNLYKMVTDFNEESQDWSGKSRDFGGIDKGNMEVNSVEEALQKIQKTNFIVYPFEAVPDEPRRYETNQVEDQQGNVDENGKFLCDYSVYLKLYKQASQNKKAAEPETEEPVKTQFKDVKITPDLVDKEKAVPASPEQSEVIAKLQSIEANMSALDRAKEEIKAKLAEELKKIDQAGERATLESEYKNQIERLSVLIDAVDSKLVKYGGMFYSFKQEDKVVEPKMNYKDILDRVAKKIEGVDKLVQSIMNGMLSLSKHITVRTLTRWPEKRSALAIEASISDELEHINDMMLEALKLLS